MRQSPTADRLERHPLPQSTLSVALFAGVEPPVLAFEVVLLGIVVHASSMRWLVVGFVALLLAVVHVAFARATKRDRRLMLVLARSFRYPRYARPWATFGTTLTEPEPTLPRRLLL